MCKKILFFVFMYLIAGQLYSQSVGSETKIPIDTFLLEANIQTHNFGSIEQNDKTQFVFEITNIYDKPLVIRNVSSSCGCTTPTWTKKPVKKGETAKVKVKYDSSRLGHFEKSVFVYTNFGDQPIQFEIKGTVSESIGENPKTKQGVTKSKVDFNPSLSK